MLGNPAALVAQGSPRPPVFLLSMSAPVSSPPFLQYLSVPPPLQPPPLPLESAILMSHAAPQEGTYHSYFQVIPPAATSVAGISPHGSSTVSDVVPPPPPPPPPPPGVVGYHLPPPPPLMVLLIS